MAPTAVRGGLSMKAIVCDKCGKVILLPDDRHTYDPENCVCQLYVGGGPVIDLCKECADELVASVRKGD